MTKKPGFYSRLDLVELSDAFRRHATGGNKTERALVKAARRFAQISTHYHGEHPGMGLNDEVDEMLKKEARRIAALAAKLKVDQVILPHTGSRQSWNAMRIQKQVLNDLDVPVALSLQPREYARDLSALGPIDRRIKTALDNGVRGVMDINSGIRRKWDLNLGL